MSAVIRWESPDEVATRSRAAEWGPVAAELRANPNQWGLIFEGHHAKAQSVQGYVRDGRYSFAPKGAFQGRQRTVVDGTQKLVRVYARYVGEPDLGQTGGDAA